MIIEQLNNDNNNNLKGCPVLPSPPPSSSSSSSTADIITTTDNNNQSAVVSRVISNIYNTSNTSGTTPLSINGTSSKSLSIANKFISTTSLSSLLKLNKNNNNNSNNKKMSNNNSNNINNNNNLSSNSSSNTNTNTNTNNTNNNKLNLQQQITNGLFIRKEIQRFESVHPNIYSVYDLIDAISDFNLQQQIREHIVNIEGKLLFI